MGVGGWGGLGLFRDGFEMCVGSLGFDCMISKAFVKSCCFGSDLVALMANTSRPWACQLDSYFSIFIYPLLKYPLEGLSR